MQGNAQVLTALHELLSAEMAAINTYVVNAKLLSNWGFNRLAARVHEESMDEMRHAEQLVDRIIYLDQVPNLNKLGRVKVGDTVKEQFEIAHGLEVAQVGRLVKAVATSRKVGDDGTRLVLEPMIKAGEETIDWLETQLGLISDLGNEHYLAQQLHAEG